MEATYAKGGRFYTRDVKAKLLLKSRICIINSAKNLLKIQYIFTIPSG